MEAFRIHVTSRGAGMRDALAVTEITGRERGLGRRELLQLRLLSEELFGMLRSVAGEDVEADYWLEHGDRDFALHLEADVPLTPEMRERLVDVSTNGRNAASMGFMGRLLEMAAAALMPREAGQRVLSAPSLNFMSRAGAQRREAGDGFQWSMRRYRNEIGREGSDSPEAALERDELEKSIVSSIADDVRVSASGTRAEIVIYKDFRA